MECSEPINYNKIGQMRHSIEIHDMAEGNGGGVAVYNHESVSYKRRRDLEIEALEGLVVQMTFPHAKHLGPYS